MNQEQYNELKSNLLEEKAEIDSLIIISSIDGDIEFEILPSKHNPILDDYSSYRWVLINESAEVIELSGKSKQEAIEYLEKLSPFPAPLNPNN